MKRREFLGSIVALPCLAATVKHKKQPVVAARPTPPKPRCRVHKELYVEVKVDTDDREIVLCHACPECHVYHAATLPCEAFDIFTMNLYCICAHYRRLLTLPADKQEVQIYAPLPHGWKTEKRKLRHVTIWNAPEFWSWSG